MPSYLVFLPLSHTCIRYTQKVQNSADRARILTMAKRREYITPVLQKLHWLPVSRNTDCKILAFAFKAKHSFVHCIHD